MRTPEQIARYLAKAREKAAAAAIAAGREPGRVGQPPKNKTAEEMRAYYRQRQIRWRAANLERAREIGRDSMKRAAAEVALAEGREPGKVGRPAVLSVQDKAEKHREKGRRYYYKNLAKSREVAREKMQAVRDGIKAGTYKAIPWTERKMTDEERRIETVRWSQIRRARVLAVGGKYTREDVFRIFSEQGGKCAICFQPFNGEKPSIDHYRPISCGGTNDADNIQLAHISCNATKRDMPPPSYPFRSRLAW